MNNKIVKNITFSNDGKFVLASREDSDIIIFSIQDYQLSLYKILENQGTSKIAAKFFDNDKIFGFGIKDEDKVKSIKFWNMKAGALIKITNIDDPIEVCRVNFSDNNKYMIFGNHDGTITLWEITLENVNVIATFSGHVGSVCSVIFLDDKRIISGGGEDHSIKIWNTQTRELIKTFEGHTGPISFITLSPNNKELVSTGSSDHTVRFWSLNNLGIYNVHPSSIECIAISSNGKFLASGNSDNKIKLYDVNTGVCLKTLDGHKKGHIKIIQFTLDIKYIASISDNTLKFWNLEDNMFSQEIEASQDIGSSKSKKIENMMLLPKEEFIVAISGEFGKSAIVERWHLKDLKFKKMTTICLEMNSNCIIISNSAFSSDGTRFVSGGSYYYGSYHLVLWDTITGKLLAETDSLRPSCVIFYSDSYNRKLILCQNHGFNLEIFDEHLCSISIINNYDIGFSNIDYIAVSPDNKLLVVSFTEGNSKSNYKHQMQIWSNCNVYTMHFSNRINSICWNKVYESLFLVTGSDDALRYWQVKLQEDKVIYLRLSWSSYQRLLKLDGIRYNNATMLSLENSELLKQQNVSLDNNGEMLTKEWLPQFMVKA
ncbi:MAG: WD40 repeat domain-containing protein, partial [Gammaproteobacteria bacterium]